LKKQYIIAIDGGTQSTKVFIFDLKGNVICEGIQTLKPLYLAEPNVVLHPDDDLWDSLIAACRQAFRSFPGKMSEIIGVGLCTIRCCRALLKEDGTLAYPVLSWMDKRLSVPYEHENPEVRYVTTTSGYITHRLTGSFKDTVANYEGQWPVDRDKWCWSDDTAVMEMYQVPRNMLLDLVMPGDILGTITPEASRLTGIPEGIPVVATANDKAVEMLGSGPVDKTTALVSLGTYIAAMMQGTVNIGEACSYFANMASVPGRYIYESEGIRRGMWTVSWIKDLLGSAPAAEAKKLGISTENYLNDLAKLIPAGCDGLMTIPEFLAPVTMPYKRGIMIGFDGHHTGIHMYRSVLEAIALTMYNNTIAMSDELGIKLDRVIISGGGSKGDLFMQIFSDVFGLPASRNAAPSAVGVGDAICVCVGLGICKDFDEAASKMIKVRDVFKPNKANTEMYAKMNEQVYKHITEYTDEVLKKAYPVFR
jgi:sugar (pentulose or hexulose) kinase